MSTITLKRAPGRAPLFPDFPSPSFSRLFDMMNAPVAEPIGINPPMEVSEANGEFVCTAELPGMKEKEIEVSFTGNALTIKGEKTEEKETKENGKRFHVFERAYGAFERTFTFPADVDAARVSAEFKNGVLTVRLPKTKESAASNRIIPVVTK
jgi:HSP20 family protein